MEEDYWKPHQLSNKETESDRSMNGGILGAIIPGEKSTILLLETAGPLPKSTSEDLESLAAPKSL